MSSSFLDAVEHRAMAARLYERTCCRARATPTPSEIAEAIADGEDDLQAWLKPTMARQPGLAYHDAFLRACRNRSCRNTRERARAAELEEASAPPLPPTAPLQNIFTGDGSAPWISVVVPTSFTRHWAHETLYRCFHAQQWPGRLEMLVLDTGGPPSPFFTKMQSSSSSADSRVRYFHAALPPPPARTVGGAPRRHCP